MRAVGLGIEVEIEGLWAWTNILDSWYSHATRHR